MAAPTLLDYVAAVKAKQAKDAADMIAYAKAVLAQQAAHRLAKSGQSVRGVGAFDVASLDWKQLGAGALVGVGIGYVLFATK